MSMSLLKTSFLFAAALIAMPALADTHIAFVDDSGQPGTQMYVKGGKVRIESGGQSSAISIYDMASNSMTVLMPDQNKYIVFDQKTADQMGEQAQAAEQEMQAASAQAQAAVTAHQGEIDQANQQVQAAMAQMTPEQKAAMQKVMAAQASRNAPAAAALQNGGSHVEMQPLGTSETIAGHGCKDMQIVINGRPASTVCVMDSPASLGIPGADLKTLERMRDNMQKMMAHMGPMAQCMSSVYTKGFALKTTRQSMQGFKRVTTSDTFKSVSTTGLDGSLFEIPAGYTKTTIAEMMQPHP
jgi:hypothetical protein